MADQSLPVFRDADWSAPDELIVATEHLGFVRDLIGDGVESAEADHRLGLARLVLNPATAFASLQAEVAATPGASNLSLAASQPQSGSAATAVDSVTQVAGDIRAIAAARNGGWVPTIGRNRYVVFPGSDAVGVTRETSFGVQVKALLPNTNETSFGGPGRGVGAARETSFGGGGVPMLLTDGQDWAPPRFRATGPGAGVRVGLLDTGIWPHPWLDGGWEEVMPTFGALGDGIPAGSVPGHGTFTAGLILSQAPGATVVVRRVLDGDGQGNTWDVARAIVELGQSGVSVINLSFACYTADGAPPLALVRAVERIDRGVVVVAAAGNHNAMTAVGGVGPAKASSFADLPSWPAALGDVLAVGAVDREGRPAPFSPDRPWVDVTAPGVDLRSTYVPTHCGCSGHAPHDHAAQVSAPWAEWSGTSFATALVSGLIASGVRPNQRSATDVVAALLNPQPVLLTGGVSANAWNPPRPLYPRITGWARGVR